MNKEECSEQIQEDIIAYMDACILANGIDPVLGQTILEDTCDIVVNNFKKLEAEDDLIITQGDKKLKEMLEDGE
jgi:hypothetical protein